MLCDGIALCMPHSLSHTQCLHPEHCHMQVVTGDDQRMIVVTTAPVNIYVQVPEGKAVATAVEEMCEEVTLANPDCYTVV